MDKNKIADLLTRCDSVMSLVAYRHTKGKIPHDVVQELKDLSWETRRVAMDLQREES